jgi:hypothetical protein
MSQSANVTSIEAIKEFRASLCRFGEDVKNALGAVEMEIRRSLDWILHEQPAYWQMQIKRRKEELSQAQAELFRRRLQAKPGSEVRDTEQKETVRITQRRLIDAEEKLQRVKKWAPVFQHAVSEYQARARPTGDMIEGDLRVALQLLDRMTAALDAYVGMAPPSTPKDEHVTSSAAAAMTTEPVGAASMAEPSRVEASEAKPANASPDGGESSDERSASDVAPAT